MGYMLINHVIRGTKESIVVMVSIYSDNAAIPFY